MELPIELRSESMGCASRVKQVHLASRADRVRFGITCLRGVSRSLVLVSRVLFADSNEAVTSESLRRAIRGRSADVICRRQDKSPRYHSAETKTPDSETPN